LPKRVLGSLVCLLILLFGSLVALAPRSEGATVVGVTRMADLVGYAYDGTERSIERAVSEYTNVTGKAHNPTLSGSSVSFELSVRRGASRYDTPHLLRVSYVVNATNTPVDDLVSAACRTNSFTPETRVLMADGTTKAIEDIRVGDQVVAFDPETGERGPRTVTDTIVGDGVKQLVGIRIRTSGGESTIWATEHHPFWNPAAGEWVDAGDLQVGSELLTDDGDRVTVTGTSEVARVQRVHNLTVDGSHTYYVFAGDKPILVHNCIRGTQGLEHSFDRHSAQWFGRNVARDTHMDAWTKLLERAAGSSKSFAWSSGSSATRAHLARIDGKNFVVQFFADGPRAGEVATAFVPSQRQLTAMLWAAR
jgi:hypothetical protein